MLQYGESSWELDALEPKVLAELVTSRVAEFKDTELFEARKQYEQDGRERIRKLAENGL